MTRRDLWRGPSARAFYDAFWRELGVSGAGDYDRSPTHYVSRYGANYFHEDIADTFAVFVLGGEPGKNTVAEEKLRFFWRGPRYDGAALSADPAKTWGLEWPEEATYGPAPEQPEVGLGGAAQALKTCTTASYPTIRSTKYAYRSHFRE